MVVKSLDLKNFRNYHELHIDFDPFTNIFYGNNAQGKTNILESVYLGGTTKSHKGSKDRDMITFTEEESHIRMLVQKKNLTRRIDMHLKKNKTKGIAVDGIPIKKASELFGIVNLVFFSPEDLNIIKNGPSERRRFIDLELCQLDKIYFHNLSNYNKILIQRNKLLKDIAFHPEWMDTLEIWDMQLAGYGSKIIKRRHSFVEQLGEIAGDIHENLTGGREHLSLLYEPDCPADALYEQLKKNRDKDIRYKMTSQGPHRDDLCMQVKDVDIRKFGSQGQQRTSALTLKLSEIELVKKIIHDTPVLLLDDVLSELDSSRQNYLLNSIHDIQTLITCTGLDEFISNRFTINRIFRVEEGTVTTEN
ncbi:DNA replication/repair protein RecF [Oscillospiraceae bacterium Marseille-Q3528]|nr:DNA replication/repair protein RecF [Oscillospiraceae bacterium Marseille-Q3528]